MFGCAHYGADDADESPDLGAPFRSKKGGIRRSLPSPVLATIVLVFVALPLFLPDSETKGPDSTARAVFDLAADVTSVTISSNAEHLAATSRDCPIWIWAQGHKASWNQMLLPEHRPGGSRCLAVSPDGEMLAAGNLDGTISLWDPVSGSSSPRSWRARKSSWDCRSPQMERCWRLREQIRRFESGTLPPIGCGQHSKAIADSSPRWHSHPMPEPWLPAARIKR